MKQKYTSVKDCVFFQLASASRNGIQYWNKKVEAFGLTGVQAMVVNFLGECNGVTFQQLSEQLHLTSATLTGIVDRLEKTDLVIRVPNPEDRRSLLVTLTDKGEALISDLNQCTTNANLDFLSSLSKEEETMLRGLLNRLIA